NVALHRGCEPVVRHHHEIGYAAHGQNAPPPLAILVTRSIALARPPPPPPPPVSGAAMPGGTNCSNISIRVSLPSSPGCGLTDLAISSNVFWMSAAAAPGRNWARSP